MEIMTMSKPNQGGEVFHFSHLQHPLVPLNLPYLFTCMGCKEYGAGLRFRCQTCDFKLHDFCALAPSLIAHLFHMKHHQLIFFTKPGGFLRSKCDICCKAMIGYAFHCTTCDLALNSSQSLSLRFLQIIVVQAWEEVQVYPETQERLGLAS
ncbi:uncharacterized protein LOC120278544 [Dioscorea cayenensis subsp. rotundata]|uniref:Uncharacterized protein LOC120278544 n=1 Tax=Dioscorea cayennensis subsp. rotundata TaxID=55577 RepID=A0AB40CRT4_DIOCR|nr:uncharacterized protein LOC120278544 [Dioscorea cayenensis subsp. rotundata]